MLTFFCKSLPFQKVLHKVETCDAQPSNPAAGSIIVLVTGLLKVRPLLRLTLMSWRYIDGNLG